MIGLYGILRVSPSQNDSMISTKILFFFPLLFFQMEPSLFFWSIVVTFTINIKRRECGELHINELKKLFESNNEVFRKYLKDRVKDQWGFVRNTLYKNKLIFLCSRKAHVEVICRTSLWELFWFDLTWYSYKPVWMKSLDDVYKTGSVSVFRMSSLAKYKEAARAFQRSFCSDSVQQLYQWSYSYICRWYKAGLENKCGIQSYLGKLEKGHEKIQQGQLQRNAVRD